MVSVSGNLIKSRGSEPYSPWLYLVDQDPNVTYNAFLCGPLRINITNMSNPTPLHRKIVARYGEATQPGTLHVLEFDKRARARRSLKTTAVCLATTALCICIPGAHFVLVPLGLLLTPFLVYTTAMTMTKIVDSSVSCPHCGHAVSILTSRERYPIYENCSSCKHEIKIVREG
jgi:hypothetical protein